MCKVGLLAGHNLLPENDPAHDRKTVNVLVLLCGYFEGVRPDVAANDLAESLVLIAGNVFHGRYDNPPTRQRLVASVSCGDFFQGLRYTVG